MCHVVSLSTRLLGTYETRSYTSIRVQRMNVQHEAQHQQKYCVSARANITFITSEQLEIKGNHHVSARIEMIFTCVDMTSQLGYVISAQ